MHATLGDLDPSQADTLQFDGTQVVDAFVDADAKQLQVEPKPSAEFSMENFQEVYHGGVNYVLGRIQ